MICKVCNSTIDDNAQVCPFCGTMLTTDVDPGLSSGFPDPAAPQAAPVDLSKPEPQSDAQPTEADLGLSEPAQYTDPMANQNTQQPYANNVNDAPTGQPVQPDYGQNSYSQNSYDQNNYSQNYGGGYTPGSPELEKEAQTIMTLGIVAIAVGFCCCALVGPICGGIGLSKFSKLQDSLGMLSQDAQKKATTGRILCIIGIVVGALSMVFSGIASATGSYQQILENLQK